MCSTSNVVYSPFTSSTPLSGQEPTPGVLSSSLAQPIPTARTSPRELSDFGKKDLIDGTKGRENGLCQSYWFPHNGVPWSLAPITQRGKFQRKKECCWNKLVALWRIHIFLPIQVAQLFSANTFSTNTLSPNTSSLITLKLSVWSYNKSDVIFEMFVFFDKSM